MPPHPLATSFAAALDATSEPVLAVAWGARTGASDLLADLLRPLGWDGVIERGALGAPRSPWLDARGLSIGVSHTQGLAAACVARGGMAGVDVEVINPAVDAVAVAEMRFDRQAADLVATAEAEERLDRFFRLWTLKEAALKALGTGFSNEPSGLTMKLDPLTVAGVEPHGLAWRAFAYDVGPDHRLAAALLAPPGAEPLVVAGPVT